MYFQARVSSLNKRQTSFTCILEESVIKQLFDRFQLVRTFGDDDWFDISDRSIESCSSKTGGTKVSLALFQDSKKGLT